MDWARVSGPTGECVDMPSTTAFRLIVPVFILMLGTGPAATQSEPSAAGLWEQVGESGKPESWFRIYERNGLYEGKIVKIFFPPGQDPNQIAICDKCEGADRNAPVLGLTLIKGMQRTGGSYENGTILDPRDGTVYRALMKLSPDGKKLEVRGFLGISLFGRSQTWNRLPDNLDPPATASRPAARPGGAPSQKK
jgi:Uncharacterized protein conserved in bacteria (DUF2147)